MCEIWLKSVYSEDLEYEYVEYNGFVTFCIPFLYFLFFLVVAYIRNDWTDFNACDVVSRKEVPFVGVDNDR